MVGGEKCAETECSYVVLGKTSTEARLLDVQALAFFGHYFVFGLVSGGLSSTLLGVFYGYLVVPNYIMNTYTSIINMPPTFGFIFGLVSDSCPIRGLRRTPYMAFGWTICIVALGVLSLLSLPAPYYCVGKDGNYLTAEPPCNPDASKSAPLYVIFLCLCTLGVVIADAAASGLLVEYTQKEPEVSRGSIVAKTQMARFFGQGVATGVVGIGMNSKQYLGTFDWGLTFNQACFICLLPAVCLCVCLLKGAIPENSIGTSETTSFRRYLNSCWSLLVQKTVLYLMLWQLGMHLIGAIKTPAGVSVGLVWAGQKQLQLSIFDFTGYIVLFVCAFFVKKYLLDCNWRLMLCVSLTACTFIDAVPTFLTVYNVIRNQYFFLGDKLLEDLPMAAKNVVSSLILAEMADAGSEALFYGLLNSVAQLFFPVSIVLSNYLFSFWSPNLSDPSNYVDDTFAFRNTVASSYCITYCFSLFSLVFLLFIPNQKQEALQWKRDWPRSQVFGFVIVAVVLSALAYTFAVFVLTMDPSTSCLRFVGGQGC